MPTKTSAQLEAELNGLIYESTVNDPPWTQAVKRDALNRALRASWPNFKIEQRDNSTLSLTSGTYVYVLSQAAFASLEDLGGGQAVSQARLEPRSTNTDWPPLRGVTQFFNGTNWGLRIPERIVENYSGKKLEIRWYKRVPEITNWTTDTLDLRYVNFVIHRAAVYLIRLFMQGGSDFNVDLYPQLLREYLLEAEKELLRNTDVEMRQLVGSRQEDDRGLDPNRGYYNV